MQHVIWIRSYQISKINMKSDSFDIWVEDPYVFQVFSIFF